MRLSGQEIRSKFDENYNQAWYCWSPLFPLADRDLRFFLGDQWAEDEKREMFQQGRSLFVNNFVRPNINMVTGYQKKHRHSSVVVPIEDKDQKTADQLTKLLLYSFQYGDAHECISECFSGALKTGWNLLSLWKDYREDPRDGDIKYAREPYSGWICDPYLTKKDLSDCAYIMRRKYLSLDQTISLLPSHKKDLKTLYNVGWERDDKFSWLPYQQQPNGQKMMAYNEHWEQGWEKKKFLYNAQTGMFTPYLGEESDYFLYADPNVELVERDEPYVLQHIIVNDQYIHTEKNPYDLNEYPFVVHFCVFEPESSDYCLKVQSLIRAQIDPQRQANRTFSQITDIIESSINSGWIAEEDSCVNPRSLYKSGQGQVIWKKKGSQPGALERIQSAQVSPSIFDLRTIAEENVRKVVNISEELLGMADSEKDSGLKVMLRQGAALVGLQDLFDNVRYAQELVSRKTLKIIQGWSHQKLRRILNEEPTETLREKQTIKFDVAVQEGLLTDTQKQMYFRQLIDLKQLTDQPSQGPITANMLVKAAPLQGKSELSEQIEQNEKAAAEAAQKKAQVQQQLQNMQMQLFQSQSINNVAAAKERFTRAVANMGLEDERASQAVENRADAVLRRAQAAKELEAMDDDRLVKLLDVFAALEELNRQKEEAIKREDVQLSAQATNQNEVQNAQAI